MAENLTKHSTWSGVEVYVDTSGTFYAKVDDIEISNDRLAAVRDAIDRAMKPTAKKAKLALPVLVITDDKITPTTLTGVSRTNREMEFPSLKIERYSRGGMTVIADTPTNRVLAETLLHARRAFDTATEDVKRRRIGVGGYGRIEIDDYQSIIDTLAEAHKKSAKESA